VRNKKIKPKLLFIYAKVHPHSAQGIRYTYFLKYFSKEFGIKQLTLSSKLLTEKESGKNQKLINNSAVSTFSQITFRIFKNIFKQIVEPFLFPDKYIFYLKKYKKFIKIAFSKSNYNYVFLGMTPFSFYKLATFVRKQFPEVKIIADLSDPYSGNANKSLTFFYKSLLIHRFEQFHLKSVDKVIILNPVIQKFYQKTFPEFLNRFEIIEQGLSRDFTKNRLPKPNLQKNSITLVYAGGFYRNFREPFELYKAINTAKTELRLRLFGNYRKIFHPNHRDKRLIYRGVIKQEELIKEYINADIIVFIDNFFGIQVPGKTLELMGMNKPILFIYENEDSPTLHYIGRYPKLIKVKNEASKILNEINRIPEMTFQENPNLHLNSFTWEELSKKYTNILKNV